MIPKLGVESVGTNIVTYVKNLITLREKLYLGEYVTVDINPAIY
jgi:hypothetical protein